MLAPDVEQAKKKILSHLLNFKIFIFLCQIVGAHVRESWLSKERVIVRVFFMAPHSQRTAKSCVVITTLHYFRF